MRSAIVVAFCLPLVLTGCSLSPTASPSPDAGLAIVGSVHGGQQPIVGAHIYLFAANNGGYGGPGIAASVSNASVSLLNAAATGHSDIVGAYVLTTAGGAFSISGDYFCTPNTQVYLYALGGDSGAGTNSAAGLLAVLGNCPSATNFATATPYVVVNEVSTVAAAYAFSGFASDAIHVASSGTPLAQIGIQNAFANATNLATLGTGVALATTTNGNGTVPQSEINTLANILASCINTSGAISGPSNPTPCYTLVNSALSGGSSGAVPADTATAAINIAHNPGSNIATLFGLPTAQAPFAPALSAQPTDFTVAVQFTGGGLVNPTAIAIDGSGNAWMTNNHAPYSVTELSSIGTPLSPSNGYTGGSLSNISSIAIDSSGNAWIPDQNNNKVTKLSSTGSVLAAYTGPGGNLSAPFAVAIDGSDNAWITNNAGTLGLTKLSSTGVVGSGVSGYTGGLLRPISIAIDGSSNVWVADNNNSNVVEFTSAGTLVAGSPFTGGGLATPQFIAIDGSGSAWIANYGFSGNGSITKLSSTGAAISPATTGYNGGGVNHPYGIALDGSGNIWVANNSANTVTELANSGAAISPSTGYLDTPAGTAPDAIAVDGSGNVWTANAFGSGSISELIGAATPVVTPLSAAVRTNSLAAKP